MGVKDQISKIKDNWLIILVVLGIFVFFNMSNVFYMGAGSLGSTYSKSAMYNYDMESSNYYRGGGYYPESEFAPDVEERKIIKTLTMSTEVKKGDFYSSEKWFKDSVSSNNALIINENVNSYGNDWREYRQGRYTIKVDVNKYDSLVSELRKIGKVTNFQENVNDVTGRYTNLEINLEIEKTRLNRYLAMYDEAKTVKEKIDVDDKLFNQERIIKYLEDSIKNMDQRIDYTTIYFNLNEQRSGYSNIMLVKFSTLIKNLVDSFNSLLVIFFVLIPWLTVGIIIYLFYRLLKRKN
jgi:hypothetical protein